MGSKLMPCNLTEEEKAAAWEEFGGELLTEEEAEMIGEVLPQYLFYTTRRRGEERECVCTHHFCGRFSMTKKDRPDFFRSGHGKEIRCPRCGAIVKLISLGRIRTFGKINSEPWARITICRSGRDGALMLMSGYVKREFWDEDLRPMPEVSWKTFTWLKPGKRMQWIRTWEPRDQDVCGHWWWDFQWNPAEGIKEPFQPFFRGWYSGGSDGDSYFLNVDAISRSALRYCQVEEWYREEAGVHMDLEDTPVRNVVKYLAAYTAYPSMEMAVKLGLCGAATDLAVEGRKNFRDLNWDAQSIQSFLRLDKQDAKAFLNAGGDLKLLKAYHKARKTQITGNMQEFLSTLQAAGRPDLAERLVAAANKAGGTLRMAGNYVSKFPEGIDRVLTTWEDYLNMAHTLGYDMTRRDVTMPKDLQDRHDAASETLRYQRITVDERKYAAFNKQLRKMYEFQYGDLCIQVPGSVEEIVQEGKTLKHCVGGYAARHFANQVTILFLRHKRKPNTPFITIEIAPRKTMKEKVVVRQIHGYRNETYLPREYGGKVDRARPNVKYKWFLDIWKEWVKNGSRRDKDGKPVLPGNKEKTA